MCVVLVVEAVAAHDNIRYYWRRADAPAVCDNFGRLCEYIGVALDRLPRMCNISIRANDSFTPQRREQTTREALARAQFQHLSIPPVVLIKDAPVVEEARQPHPAGPLEARDRVATLTMPVLLDRESQVVVELERHGAHLDDVVVILCFAFGAFPSYLIDLLLGAAVGFAAHLCCSVQRSRSAALHVVTRSLEVAVVSRTGLNYCSVIYAPR